MKLKIAALICFLATSAFSSEPMGVGQARTEATKLYNRIRPVAEYVSEVRERGLEETDRAKLAQSAAVVYQELAQFLEARSQDLVNASRKSPYRSQLDYFRYCEIAAMTLAEYATGLSTDVAQLELGLTYDQFEINMSSCHSSVSSGGVRF